MKQRMYNLRPQMIGLAGLAVMAGAICQANAQQIKAVEPYRSRMATNANYNYYSSWSEYYRWPGYAPFIGGAYVAPGYTRVYQSGVAQCVQFARQVSNYPGTASSQWIRDRQLVVNGKIRSDLQLGDLIATMDGASGKYASSSPHVAVFLRRISDTRIEVCDQNFIATSIVGKHRSIRIGGANSSNASRYWTIKR